MLSIIMGYNFIHLIFNILKQVKIKISKKHLTNPYFVLYLCHRKSGSFDP